MNRWHRSRLNRLVFIPLFAVAVATVGALPASATMDPVPVDGDVDVAVMLGSPNEALAVGEQFNPQESTEMGIDLESLTPMSTAPPPDKTLTMPIEEEGQAQSLEAAAPSGSYTVAMTWTARDGAAMLMRRGYYNSTTGAGFGWAKVYNKHNITGSTLKKAMTQYDSRYLQSGTKWNYWKKVALLSCNPLTGCYVKDTKSLVFAYDFRKLTTDNRHFGIVTGYCYGIDGKCPDWVNRTVLV